MTHERLNYPHPIYLCPVKPGWPVRRVSEVEDEMRERAKLIARSFPKEAA